MFFERKRLNRINQFYCDQDSSPAFSKNHFNFIMDGHNIWIISHDHTETEMNT
jgi:hypothetical protein